MSEFRKWLENNKNHDALKDNSYKNVYMHEKKVPYEGEVNTQLATYGDAVLKLALCDILLRTLPQSASLTAPSRREP